MKKIRYTFEAEVDNNFPLSPTPMLGVNPPLISEGRTVYHTLGAVTISVEEVLPPEPEYKPGSVWETLTGVMIRRRHDKRWEEFGTSVRYDHDEILKPLKLLKDADPC